jgi:hypothetical protein
LRDLQRRAEVAGRLTCADVATLAAGTSFVSMSGSLSVTG